ncbi:MAG: tRNA 4-thiouridine(8) synthase ThiI [Clostridiales Family XIII bacterium]|nr:tRNA 4-thiouridine(8) synthase ThiI [Clostridiales Family XIII bacterium]
MNTQNILIVRYGEIALKGMNKPYFEKTLLRRIRKGIGQRFSKEGDAQKPICEIVDGLIVVRGYAPGDEEALAQKILRVFGVATVSPAWELASREPIDIKEAAVQWVERRLGRETGAAGALVCPERPLTFKIFGKRSDKTYPITSPELAAAAGEAVIDAFADLVKVNVNDPELRLHIHLRRKNVLLYEDMLKGFGGLPLGTNGKGLVLLSGGIDSPVAAWYMAKRGMAIEAVHFHSYPYTSKRAEEKAAELADTLASYCGRVKVHILNLLPAQEALAEVCPENEMTILVRRFMMRIASRVAEREGCGFLVTGENLGQVASQTAEGIAVTDRASSFPVLRPLIALDKIDIIERARDIGTYEISILPYEDCCTVFLPKHPATRPAIGQIEASEGLLGAVRIAALEEEALASEELYIAKA